MLMQTKFRCINPKERENYGGLDVDEREILKLIIESGLLV
jgi:hypothetical protein